MIGSLQVILFALVAAGGAAVLTRDPVAQSITVSFYGVALALLFFVHRRPTSRSPRSSSAPWRCR
jgi:hypothetical protein